MIILKLYIFDKTPDAVKVIEDLTKVLEREFEEKYVLEIIDVFANPHLAQKARVFITPTVTKEQPLPSRRILGDLSNIKKVLVELSLTS